MKRIKFVLLLVLAGLFASLLTGCSSTPQPSQKDKEDIAKFYVGFAKEATSLNNSTIKEKYAGLAAQNFTGQGANAARSKMLSEFDSIKPDLFSKIRLEDASNGAVGNTYITVLLLSLVTEGKGIDLKVPIDAVSARQDEKLGLVYEIDRSQITATVPETVAAKLTRPDSKTLSPAIIVKDGNSWKVQATTNPLAEIGIPISEKIDTPPTTK